MTNNPNVNLVTLIEDVSANLLSECALCCRQRHDCYSSSLFDPNLGTKPTRSALTISQMSHAIRQ